MAHVGPSAHQIVASIATETPLLANIDAALEWCESRLLEDATHDPATHLVRIELGEHDLLRGLTDSEVAVIAGLAQTVKYPAGEALLSEGDSADAVFLLLAGTVTVWLAVGADGRRHRLATFGPGMAFGEMALLVEGPRSADVETDEPVVVARLALADLRALELMAAIYRNLARTLGGRLRRANAQVRALKG